MVKFRVGIDVSAKSFVVSYGPDSHSKHKKYANTPTGIKAFLKSLTAKSLPAENHCVLEATGTYSQRLSYALATNGYVVSVINPRQSKSFAQLYNLQTKTDLQDARMLARMGAELELPLYQAQSEEAVQIKQRRTLLNQLKKQLQSLKNLQHSQTYSPFQDELTAQMIKDQISTLKKRVKELEKALASFTEENFSKQYQLLNSIKGIGPAGAAALIQATSAFQNFTDYKSFAKFIGVAPTEHQSGTSVYASGKISRRGDPGIRALLYCCANVAKRWNPACKELFERLRKKGKPYKVAVVAVINKLLKIAFAIIQSGVLYKADHKSKRPAIA
jgi:transposase